MNDVSDAASQTPDQVEIRINGQVFVTAKRPLSGAELRRLPTPPLGGDQDIYQVNRGGGADVVVADEQLIDLDNGADFFSTPRTILAGLERGPNQI